MGLFSKWFGSRRTEEDLPPEHAVIIHFRYGSTNLQPIFDLEDELERAINAAQVGQFDGNEVAVDGSDGSLYMYGPDADRLFATVKPILETRQFMHGATATLRYGPPKDGIRAIEVKLGP
jgi:hypothetical protein